MTASGGEDPVHTASTLNKWTSNCFMCLYALFLSAAHREMSATFCSFLSPIMQNLARNISFVDERVQLHRRSGKQDDVVEKMIIICLV